MENKATDKEIKKALERCTSVAYRGVCKDCVYMKFKMTDQGCLTPMLKDVLDLINRLEAEVERLKISNFQFISDINGYKEKLKTAKSEAVKEFAEKAKEEFAGWVGADNSITYHRIKKVVDNLAKEMEKKYDNRADN